MNIIKEITGKLQLIKKISDCEVVNLSLFSDGSGSIYSDYHRNDMIIRWSQPDEAIVVIDNYLNGFKPGDIVSYAGYEYKLLHQPSPDKWNMECIENGTYTFAWTSQLKKI